MTYLIRSTGGHEYGLFEGATPAEALLALHRDAGYGPDVVSMDGGRLRFAEGDGVSASPRDLLGDVDDWEIVPASERPVYYDLQTAGRFHR